jgi:O-antigen/teichoic acid export membrane protein
LTTVRRSLAYSAADSYLSVVMQLAATVIIARLLTPAETGVFAVAAVFAALASTFRDFGVAEYLIQEQTLTDDKIRSALTANIVVSWAMGLLLFGGSQAAAGFYRHPGIAEVMQVQSINFLLIPFGAVTMAYFRRQMDFRPIFLAGLAANLTQLGVAVALALAGFGYMSLAWASLAGTAVTVLVSVLMRPAGFPRWPGLAEIRSVVRFGKHASGIYLFGQAGKSAPEIIIGRALDMPSVAYFSRANGLIEIFHRTVLKAIMPVCMPYFARSNREQGNIVPGYLAAMAYLTAIGWSFFLFLGIVAYGAVRLIYGDQWLSSVPLAQILCAAALIEIIHVLATEAIIAMGRVDRSNALQFGIQGTRILGLLLVIPFGLEGGCWGLLAAAAVGSLYAQWMLHRTIGLAVGEVLTACRPSALVAVIANLPVAMLAWWLPVGEGNYLHFLFGGGALMGLVWLLAVRRFMPRLWTEITGIAGRLLPAALQRRAPPHQG